MRVPRIGRLRSRLPAGRWRTNRKKSRLRIRCRVNANYNVYRNALLLVPWKGRPVHPAHVMKRNVDRHRYT